METTYIYILIDPRNGQIRYAGKADSHRLKRRFNSHISEANNKKSKPSHKNSWILGLLKENLKPIMEIIDEVPRLEWKFWERHYVSLYRSWGFDLTNLTDGGDGVENPSAEARSKMGNRNPRTKEEKEKISKSRKGIPAWNKGLKDIYSKATLDNISNSLKGNIPWNKGKKTSPATDDRKRKVRESCKLAWKKKVESPEFNSEESKQLRIERAKKRAKTIQEELERIRQEKLTMIF